MCMELIKKIISRLRRLRWKEVFYIGGSDVLPPPLSNEEEKRYLEKYIQGNMEARGVLIERNLRFVVYIAKKFENSGVNTAKLPVYKNKEMEEMMLEIKSGNMEVREKFLYGNLRLVLSVIQRFNNRGENPDDLFQIGCIGLIKALDNFDLSHGVRFSTYAVPMIIGEIRRYLRDNNAIRVSRSLRDIAYKALATKEMLNKKMQKEPTIDDIAKEMEITKEEIVLALDAIQEPVSLFEPVFQDDGDALYVMDQVQDNKNTDEKWIENIALSEAMSKLTERERHILNMRFFQGKTQMEVADEIAISQAQVSRLEKNALKFMKKYV